MTCVHPYLISAMICLQAASGQALKEYAVPVDEIQKAELQMAGARFVEAFMRGDTAALTALFDDDAQVIWPIYEAVVGRPAIRSLWQRLIDGGIREIRLATLERTIQPNMTQEIGRYVLHGHEGRLCDSGQYFMVWKRADGQWKLFGTVFTSDDAPRSADETWISPRAGRANPSASGSQ